MGFNASKSRTSELTKVEGLAFNVCSTTHMVVERTFSVIDLFRNTSKVRCCGWVELQSDSSLNNMFFDPFFFHAARYAANFRPAPTKFVPLSLIIVWFSSSRNKSHICIETIICVQLGYHFFMHRSHI